MTELYDIEDHESFFVQFGLHKISHYAFVSSDTSTYLKTLADRYNIPYWYRPKLKSYQYFEGDQPVSYTTADLVFGYLGRDQIEVIEAVPTENNIYGQFARKGAGLHHYGFEVSNVEKAIEQFNEAGYKAVCTGSFKTKSGFTSETAFFDTINEVGAYTELVESRLYGAKVTRDKSLLDLGVFLGDIKKIRI